MNIQNLNQEELQQLQVLLNKMNPVETTQTPVDKMIDNILENFNFDRVQITMDYLNWKWVGEYVTTEMLVKEARRLLKDAAESRLGKFKNEHWEQGIIHGTGGFQAQAWCNESKTKITGLDLKFVLTEWGEEIED